MILKDVSVFNDLTLQKRLFQADGVALKKEEEKISEQASDCAAQREVKKINIKKWKYHRK